MQALLATLSIVLYTVPESITTMALKSHGSLCVSTNPACDTLKFFIRTGPTVGP